MCGKYQEGRQNTGRGRSRSLRGARCGTRSQDPKVMAWAQGRNSTTEPPGSLYLLFLLEVILLGRPYRAIDSKILLLRAGSTSEVATTPLIKRRRFCTIHFSPVYANALVKGG